jgi:hypothetical protein
MVAVLLFVSTFEGYGKIGLLFVVSLSLYHIYNITVYITIFEFYFVTKKRGSTLKLINSTSR